MRCNISHVDTCLPCYANRTHDLAIAVDGASTLRDVLDAMQRDAHTYGFQAHGDDASTSAHYEAFDRALDEIRANLADRLDGAFMSSLEIDDDNMTESVYAYFDVRFTSED